MGIHHKYFYKLYILTFKISTLGFSFLVLSGLRPVWRVSVGNSCCHPVLDAALGLQLDQILLVGQLSRCRLLIQPQSSCPPSAAQVCNAMSPSDQIREISNSILVFLYPPCTLETGSAVFSSLCFVAFSSWFPAPILTMAIVPKYIFSQHCTILHQFKIF